MSIRDEQCMYCEENEKLLQMMIPVCNLQVSKVYLFRDQTYRGRIIVAANHHYKEIYEFPREERVQFFEDISNAAKALSAISAAEKINYGVFGDGVPHYHVHLVPKRPDYPDFGRMFQMNCKPPVTLTDEEYNELIHQYKVRLL
ncbi:MAG: hypothetical protein ACFWUC_04395 [Oscillospiraceae bacterium]|jgi:ATP adenylyltransferase